MDVEEELAAILQEEVWRELGTSREDFNSELIERLVEIARQPPLTK